MGFEQFFHAVESRLFALGRRLCTSQATAAGEGADELGRLEDDLRGCREEMAEVRRRLKGREARMPLLAAHVQSFVYVHDGPRAWQHALELDDIRRGISGDRHEMRRLLQRERELLDGVHELRGRLIALGANPGRP